MESTLVITPTRYMDMNFASHSYPIDYPKVNHKSTICYYASNSNGNNLILCQCCSPCRHNAAIETDDTFPMIN